MQETVLALDFGLKHIGLAVGQTVTGTAGPLSTLAAKGGKPDWSALDRILEEWAPSRLIVGLPWHMDGSESEMSRSAREFAALLAARYPQPVELIDERLTSREAQARQPKQDPHALAASLIAETWLNS